MKRKLLAFSALLLGLILAAIAGAGESWAGESWAGALGLGSSIGKPLGTRRSVASADFQNALPQRLEHPYLYFNREELPALRRRVKSEPRARAVFARILKECSRLLDMPVSRIVPARTTGSVYYDRSNKFENYRNELSLSAYYLAFAFQMTGEPRYAKKAYEFADALCELDSWVETVNEFHPLYWMGKPYGAKWNEEENNEIVFSYDVMAAWITRQLAATYDWTYESLDKQQRNRIRNGLLENAILRVRNNYDYHWWAHAWRTNWLPACWSGLGVASLALYPEDPQLAQVAEEAWSRIGRFLDESVGLEGGFQEGVGYWAYSTEMTLLFADALKRISGGKFNLFSHSRLRASIQFPLYTFIPPAGSVPFGDNREPLQGSWELYNKLAQELRSPQAKWLAQFFNPFDAGSQQLGELEPFSIIWDEAAIEASLLTVYRSPSIHFRNVDWVIMRAAWDNPDYPILAAKGGALDDPHHGHLDAGQFAISYKGEWFVRELEKITPSPAGYWDHRRRFRDYVHANSEGHNVIFVNEERQEYGPQFSARVEDFRTSPTQDYTRIDVTKAFPGKELKRWKRHILFEKPSLFVILDEVDSAAAARIALRIHPGVGHQLHEDHVLLKGKKGTMAIVPFLSGQFSLREDRHAILPEVQTAAFRWIPYFELTTRATAPRTYLVTLFAPVTGDEEARAIRKSGGTSIGQGVLRLHFTYKNRPYSFVFPP